MARARSPNRDKAFEIYKDHEGDIKLIDIAKELNIKDSQIRKWKSQDNWDEKLKGALPISKSNVTNQIENKTNIKKDSKEPIAEEVKEVLGNTELTDKQRLFCIYYIKYFNATKAYQKAYNSSYIVANSEGYKLLVNPCIKSEIEKLKQHKLNQVMLSEEDIFQRYMDIAFSDITDYVNFGKREIEILEDNQSKTIEVNYVDFNDSYNVDGTIISEVKQGKDGVSIKLHDKMKALQWLSDHMNIATDKQKLELEVLKSRIVKDNSKNNTNSTAKLDSILGQIKERNKNE
ncbi:phage portal protein [Clostridium perfringens]|nr:terminase small subunit [Clostridium perfringens]HAT4231229.1 phage portal protein [Clostridium perfringens]HBI6980279.1 terminase small subunit [Clostridium perfringens]HBI7009613.1 terminase small subunit [Clostridium perfringens]HBI7167416.1 terminase small subunit [Clostridium perfringens]